MRIRLGLLGLWVGTGCLGGSSPPAIPDAGALRPLVQPVLVQAAHNDTTFFLHVQWVSDSQAPTLSVAVSGRSPNPGIRDFANAGCFLGCHDSSEDMPNWQPEDGPRPMFLFPGFGGPGDVWMWSAQPGNPVGQVVDNKLDAQGLAPDPDGGAEALAAVASLTERTWDVVFERPLASKGAGDVPLQLGAVYDFGLALHPDGISGRNHYVSLPLALGLDAPSGMMVTAFTGPAPDFSDMVTYPAQPVQLFLPGFTSFEFLVGAVVNRNGQLRANDFLHGGAHQVATGQNTCADCHQVMSDIMTPAVQNGGALSRLVLRRGGVFGPPMVEVAP